MNKRAGSAGAVLLGIAIAMAGCSSSQQGTEGTIGSASEERMEHEMAGIDGQEKQQALDELDDLRGRLNKRLNNVDAEMRRKSDEAQLDRLRDHRFEVEQNRARVEDEIRNIEMADRATWNDVRMKATSTASDVGEWLDRQADDLMDGEKENEGMEDQHE